MLHPFWWIMFTVDSVGQHHGTIYPPTLGAWIRWLSIGWLSANTRLILLADRHIYRLMYRPIPNQHTTNTQLIFKCHSTDCQPIYWLFIVQHLADTRSVYTRPMYRLSVGWFIGRGCWPTLPTLNSKVNMIPSTPLASLSTLWSKSHYLI